MATPLEISIAIHYHTIAGDFRHGDFSAPILPETMQRYVEAGLLRDLGVGDGERAPGQRFQPTPGLAVYIDALCNVPLPVQKWIIPAA